MSRSGWLVLAIAGLILSGSAWADPASDSTMEARLRALEKRVSDLEQERAESSNAALEKRISRLEKPGSDSQAAPPASLEKRVSKLEEKTEVPAAPGKAAAPSGPPRWQDHAAWSSLRIGMTWSQVKKVLGVPGRVKAGVFGDVMYFPNDAGGSVEFDRDGRVSAWTEKPLR